MRPLQPFGAFFSSFRYTLLDSGHESDTQQPLARKLKDSLSSKILWRLMVVLAVLLLTLDLLRPSAKSYLGKYASGAPPGQEPSRPEAPGESNATTGPNSTDWSRFAYCQYVTNAQYLCNSVMIFKSLTRLGSKASKIMMYPEQWDLSADDLTSRLLIKARDQYGVALIPIKVQHLSGEATWADSFTKLLAFNQTRFDRVLSLDSDATVLQPMDELFLLPPAPVAMPRAYWLKNTLSSQLVLIEPSAFEFNRIKEAFTNRTSEEFDMEIVNNLYSDACMVLPHRRYDLLTGEFRSNNHVHYLGSAEEKWDPSLVYEEAKFVHFSDWPYPKPWIHPTDDQTKKIKPKCVEMTSADGQVQEDCTAQAIWLELYQDFRNRREIVCGSGSMSFKRYLDAGGYGPSPYEYLVNED
ncbi:glycosyltransferase family 8 protein [Polychaeton citri CBS 116435]|uniref:Glycosyltransferase family 8 protein n=1 Tax=Polychaeton citri CBS 116435 TaxID=1314669 RepID=A0A9P4UIP8_9PEZI|nr:glycosyltransferase family 8 protein [Polychaeton citri CBS 116435]